MHLIPQMSGSSDGGIPKAALMYSLKFEDTCLYTVEEDKKRPYSLSNLAAAKTIAGGETLSISFNAKTRSNCCFAPDSHEFKK